MFFRRALRRLHKKAWGPAFAGKIGDGGSARLTSALLAATALAATAAPASAAAHWDIDAYGHPLACDTGAVFKDYGGSRWKVIACADKKSLAFKADQPKGAKLCVVYLWSERAGYKFDASLCASGKTRFAEGLSAISTLTPQEIADLLTAARAGAKGGKP